MFNKILTYPKYKRELSKPTQYVTQEVRISDLFKHQIEQMSKILSESGDGAALAANQIGWDVNLFIAIRDFNYKICKSQIYINPKIIELSSSKITDYEGCLSTPDLFLKIPRAEMVEWEYQTMDGDVIKLTSKGLFARLVQHEVGHLKGRFFFENASAAERLKLNHWLKKQG